MLINVASLNICTFFPVIWGAPIHVEQPDRGDDELIEFYLERKISEKIQTFKTGLDKIVNSKVRCGECLFFTLPEFFWNVSPYAIWSKDDLAYMAEYYMNTLPKIVANIINNYPVEDFGKVILLSGTAGTLIETSNNYDAINYLLAIDNFNFNNDGSHSISMWPKTEVALFDYGYASSAGDPITFLLGKPGRSFNIRVNANGDSYAEHNANSGYGPSFDNEILQEIPFAISLCADYSNNLDFRQNEWLDKNPKIHFLIACGMSLSISKEYNASVQFAIRNDGFNGSEYEPVAGGSEVKVVEFGHITQDIAPISIDNDLYLYEINVL